MARLAGELCDGIRPPPWITSKYFKDVLLPAIEEGCRKAGRKLSDIDLVGGGITLVGKDEAEIEAKKKEVKDLIAFFGSTPAYHPVFEAHGWKDLGLELNRLSREGDKWEMMGDLITDDVVEEFAVVATYDDMVPKIKQRWNGVCTTLLLPHHLPVPKEQLQALIAEMKSQI